MQIHGGLTQALLRLCISRRVPVSSVQATRDRALSDFRNGRVNVSASDGRELISEPWLVLEGPCRHRRRGTWP